ncbi:hypothetical protein ADUPG1_002466, partial [Aduncisulcus paluster]
ELVFEGRAPPRKSPFSSSTPSGKPPIPEKVDSLVQGRELETLSQVMGPDLVDGMERMTSLAEHVSPKDREKFSKVYDPVKPEECWYEDLIIGLFKSMEDLFDDIDDTPASVEPFRVELLDETRSVAEPYRQIRRDWKHESQDQLIKMNDK